MKYKKLISLFLVTIITALSFTQVFANENTVKPQTVDPPKKSVLRNKKHIGYENSTNVISGTTASGDPGITISTNRSRTVSTQITQTYGSSISELLSSAGIQVSKSVSLEQGQSSSYKVPKIYNGKKVKIGHIGLKVRYAVYSAEVHKWNSVKHSYYKAGTTKIKVPTGLYTVKWHTFY